MNDCLGLNKAEYSICFTSMKRNIEKCYQSIHPISNYLDETCLILVPLCFSSGAIGQHGFLRYNRTMCMINFEIIFDNILP